MSTQKETAQAALSATNAGTIPHSRSAALVAALEATKTARAAFDSAKATGDRAESDKARDGLDAAAMTNLEAVIADLEALSEFYRVTEDIESDLTPEERKKLVSAKVRNNGFIDKAFNLALSNPQYLPTYITPAQIIAAIRRFEDSRQIMILGHQFLRIATDRFMIEANVAFHMALRFYGYLREQSRVNVSGAKDLFEMLKNFFSHRRRATSSPDAEPTEEEIEWDFKKLVHGKADGEVYIENEMPHTTGGGRRIVDSVHTGHTDVKADVEAEIKKS